MSNNPDLGSLQHSGSYFLEQEIVFKYLSDPNLSHYLDIVEILCRYQEKPYLLDGALPDLTNTLLKHLSTHINQAGKLFQITLFSFF